MNTSDRAPAKALVPDRDTPGAYTVRIDGTDQSWVDPGDPTRLEFEYMQRIGDVIDLMASPRERLRVVHIGGAGMALARYVAATRPTSAQLVFEPDAALTEEVRRVLPLPRHSGIKVRPIDGRSGVASLRDAYADVVILDAFVGARVPPELTTLEFLHDVRRVLRPGGTLVANVTDRKSLIFAKRVTAGFQAVFSEALLSAETALLKGRRFGNVVILGSDRMFPIHHLTRRFSSAAFPYRLVCGTALDRMIGSSEPFIDSGSCWSPLPPEKERFGG